MKTVIIPILDSKINKTKYKINNQIYHNNDVNWYEVDNNPFALLRASSQFLNVWIYQNLKKFSMRKAELLDIGCGGGFTSNFLAKKGYKVTGIDLATPSLDVAKKHDHTHSVRYLMADAYQLPFVNESFDVVCALDMLEPELVIKEVQRVLRPGGYFYFHTFNRNFWSWLLIIKAIEWFVPNTPPHLHTLDLFIKPQELITMLENKKMSIISVHGMLPKFSSPNFWWSLFHRKIHPQLPFMITKSLKTSYVGISKKN